MRLMPGVLISLSIVGCSTPAFAQLPTSKILTVDVAQAIAQEALSACRANGFKITVLVVDGLNSPKALLRDDGAPASTAEASRMKATSVMLYNRPSGPPPNVAPGAPAPPPSIPGTSNGLGGIPIKVGEATIGAVAVSGAPHGDQDQACAKTSLTKVADKLK
jgi:uncharacterized protein GlcG (DUF336 family)